MRMNKLCNKLGREITSHKFLYALLGLILLGGLFFRVRNIQNSLGFFYDQGRDALVIWDFWHKGKFFLVGPTTGIAGIFRGPFYYYLIVPFYLLGGGDPVWPSIFLSLTTILAVALMFYLVQKMQDLASGIFAAAIASFSFYMVTASRWLSNPTPMLLLSMILVWLMVLVTEGKRWAWPLISFVAGVSLFHFGSSGEFFYLPALAIFFLWQRKNWPNKNQFVLSILMFLVTVSPLVLFDIRHDGILRANIAQFFVGDRSFKGVTKYIFKVRTEFYYDVFTNKIFHWRRRMEIIMLLIVAVGFLVNAQGFWKNPKIRILLLLLFSPIVGLYFFQGNYGNIYDYYMTGYYMIFISLFGITLGRIWKGNITGKVFVLFFFWSFLNMNLDVTWSRINDMMDGENSVGFRNEKQALDWVYSDARGREFNVDVYVPPVIPYAYDYLFKWQGQNSYGYLPSERRLDLLYTIYEVDPPHPERIEAWFLRQDGIGTVEEEVRFGGIGVQRRKRL